MATIQWEIAGHITPEGDMRIGGFSMGGEQLFDEPLHLDAMIASICESNEISADHRFSPEGKAQITALAATLAQAWEDVRRRLKVNDTMNARLQPETAGDSSSCDHLVFIGKPKPKGRFFLKT